MVVGTRTERVGCGLERLALLALLAALPLLGLGGEGAGLAEARVAALGLDFRRALDAGVLRGDRVGLVLRAPLLGGLGLGLLGLDLLQDGFEVAFLHRALVLFEERRLGVVRREVGELELAQEPHDSRGLGELPDLPHEEIDHLAQLVAAGRPTEPELGASHEDLADVDLHGADGDEDRAVAALAELGGERRELREVVAGARGGVVEGLVDAREGGLGGDHESSEVFGGGGWEVA